ncbi:MAG TPA: SRPBCC domain-containing protein [Xanthomonadales bacterium]|nr:SRPBCC domain-containing protein [Xanthomonadales bacterium]
MEGRNPRAMGAFRADVARRYGAPPAKVFAAWTDPASASKWLASGGEVVMNPQVGGLFYVNMVYEGNKYPHYGRYLRVERDRVLEFTWVSEGTKGKESVVTVTFEPAGSGTKLTLAHEGLPDEENAKSHEGGWTELLEAMAKEFATQ